MRERLRRGTWRWPRINMRLAEMYMEADSEQQFKYEERLGSWVNVIIKQGDIFMPILVP